jgi:oligopeptidase B
MSTIPDDASTPPTPPREPKTLTAHGHERVDDYYWMRDDDRQDPRVLAHLQAETDYAKAWLAPRQGLQATLYDEIVGRIAKDDESVPVHLDGYWYYVRFVPGGEYPLYCRRQGTMDAPEHVFFDANRAADGEAYYQVTGLTVTRDGRTLAYAEDKVSRRVYDLRFRDLTTGEDHPEVIPGTSGDAAWALDHRTVFYVKKEEGTLREYQVWRHVLGTDPADDECVFEETDPEFHLGVWRTKSRAYVVIGSFQTVTTEMRFLPADDPEGHFRVFLPRERHHEHSIDHADSRFYVRTNWEAQNFRLMSVAPETSADKSTWREEIPHRPDVFLRSFEVFQEHLVVGERRDGLARIRVIPWADREAAHEVGFDEEVFHTDLGANPDFQTTTLRFHYTSLTTPGSVFDYEMNARTRVLKKREKVLGDFDPGRYETHRVVATARDGTRVPVSIVHRRDLDRSKPQPLLQYGYGAYGISMDPAFASPRLSLLDRGFIYAIAHIRGGQELGRPWYEAGKLAHKQNTFSDFIDVTRHLQAEGWTTPDQTFALGGSAGGLLMGAVANQAPELYRGVVAQVPFVDVVTTMLDESIPLTTFEYDEWGNPNEEAAYHRMLAYSPYDNVAPQDYPYLFVLTGLHDSQVQYWEPAKWVARLRATKTDDRPVLFHCNMDAGHGGASGRFRRHEETAMVFTFLLHHTGRADG